MVRRPGFAAAAVLTLALGIGSTTAVFSVLHGVLLRPLPIPAPQEVVSLWDDQPGFPDGPFSGPNLRDLRDQARSFESISSYVTMRARLTGIAAAAAQGVGDHPEAVNAAQTDATFFHVLRASPRLGRLYGPGSAGEVVLGEAFWRRVFGADPQVVGRTVSVDGEPRSIVGVLDGQASVPPQTDLWVSTVRDLPALAGFLEGLTTRDANYLQAIARLRPGVTLTEARGEVAAISARLEQTYPATNAAHRFRVDSLHNRLVGDAREPLLLLFGGVVLVLLIACANVASLQLARGVAAERDLAVRAALGASRGALVRQLLVESTVLALIGGALGFALSWWGVKLVVGLAGTALPRSAEIGVDPAVLAFATLLSAAAGIGSGLVPALLATRAASLAALRSAAVGHRHAGVHGVLVTAEVAFAVMLLTGGLLLLRSFERIRAVDPGFRSEGVLVLPLSHGEAGAAEFHAEIARRVAAIPGVHASGEILRLPLANSTMAGDVTPEGRPPHEGDFIAGIQVVSGEYFRAMGIPLLHGRTLTAADRKDAQRVAVVNETFAKRFYPGQDPVGKRFCYGIADANTRDWITIVGVTGDVRQVSLAREPMPEAYYPVAQSPTPPLDMTLVVRTDLGIAALLQALRAEIGPLVPDQPLVSARTLDETVAGTLRRRKLPMVLLSIFSASALLLAVLGIYATLAYSVSQRTREIGVRMALGARAESVVRLVVTQGMRLAVAGVVLGLAGAWALGRVISGLLFGVGAHDPATFALSAATLLGAAFLACWVPARRASRVDPQVALRAE
jgi:putative ABC transport system permease protein